MSTPKWYEEGVVHLSASGFTQRSRSLRSIGFGMYRIRITKVLAGTVSTAPVHVWLQRDEPRCGSMRRKIANAVEGCWYSFRNVVPGSVLRYSSSWSEGDDAAAIFATSSSSPGEIAVTRDHGPGRRGALKARRRHRRASVVGFVRLVGRVGSCARSLVLRGS